MYCFDYSDICNKLILCSKIHNLYRFQKYLLLALNLKNYSSAVIQILICPLEINEGIGNESNSSCD